MATAFTVASGTTDAQIVTGPGRLKGVACRESAGVAVAATMILRDGIDATGKLLVPIELGANSSAFVWMGDDYIEFTTGLFLDRVAGESEVTVFVGR